MADAKGRMDIATTQYSHNVQERFRDGKDFWVCAKQGSNFKEIIVLNLTTSEKRVSFCQVIGNAVSGLDAIVSKLGAVDAGKGDSSPERLGESEAKKRRVE